MEYVLDTESLLSEENKVTPLSPCDTHLALGEIYVIVVEFEVLFAHHYKRWTKSRAWACLNRGDIGAQEWALYLDQPKAVNAAWVINNYTWWCPKKGMLLWNNKTRLAVVEIIMSWSMLALIILLKSHQFMISSSLHCLVLEHFLSKYLQYQGIRWCGRKPPINLSEVRNCDSVPANRKPQRRLTRVMSAAQFLGFVFV